MRRLRLGAAALAAAAVAFSCSGTAVRSAAGAAAVPIRGEQLPNQQGIDLGKLFDAVVDTIDQRFFDTARLREIDWRSRASAARPSVIEAATTADAVRRINALLAELRTSHTGLFTPDDYQYYELLDVVGVPSSQSDLPLRRFWGSGPYYPGIGAFTRQIGQQHFVDGTFEGSPAEQAGLKYGDEILSVVANHTVRSLPFAARSARPSSCRFAAIRIANHSDWRLRSPR